MKKKYLNITDIACQLNKMYLQNNPYSKSFGLSGSCKAPIKSVSLNRWLLSKGYTEVVISKQGINKYRLTDKGLTYKIGLNGYKFVAYQPYSIDNIYKVLVNEGYF